MDPRQLQLDEEGRLKHFLSIDGLDRALLTEILDRAEGFLGVARQAVKKVPLCRGKIIANVFFENSTRTRTTFELAAKRLSADVLNVNISTSATAKGETLLDTLRNLEAMNVDMFVVRHADSGAAQFIAEHAAPFVSVINAGDGSYAHPTQGMLDMFTIRRHKGAFEPLIAVIVGDVLHSRVARSQIGALRTLGAAEVRVVAPRTLIPALAEEALGVRVCASLDEGIQDADVIIMLRLQRERMNGAFLPSEHEYFQLFGLTEQRIDKAKPDAIVMHPGPINRGVEMDSAVADGPRSVILEQVSNGLAIRMAVMSMCIGTQNLALASANRPAEMAEGGAGAATATGAKLEAETAAQIATDAKLLEPGLETDPPDPSRLQRWRQLGPQLADQSEPDSGRDASLDQTSLDQPRNQTSPDQTSNQTSNHQDGTVYG